ncbi:type II toxin-antitoxin system RelE/ParE family toxin [Rhizobium leguminosarum]|uniref:type II toxin-antitoxin system RelE/ParE family toxin n=1 Tax=Rhizobium leguminosarum TaxID=384 RepID=UPI001C903E65|nr:type II toxin-antitoxin system RelE/ParE family toxin [Rhizobium leguminosarum]MBY3174216.1 type II toxin-antitoxin system RelE/ParE family toxin [Rhizobium leguminosarum]MBY5521565.1 type II toxin-antitoxin system RelE/ParE family toxin [Rhizobium leguminosarum]MBY5549275.1 type II toxin-antitoxin system RelE/ParE family toxin [Rhizobium leguminosarum]MBY5561518.1 type II toxin-antitoxin system RelE/ParE family toxin [Rhizobium leguminosarum]MBY5586377.1 type II toxin-antitoxin system RelE
MAKYKLTPRAQRQMRDIWRNIAVHNEPAADRLLQKLFDKFELVAAHPEMGPARPEISPVARLIIEGRYIAIYEPTNYGAEIVVVVHGMHEPTTWLD